ncbi:SDR family NAD(P)-dependent oxidoreductase [Microbacterium pseudoresistens]|uniref:3-oxoacyl-[acyl-carrier protein] reductase n=1 Tax=Microbacterium pseudoresistens TaxID=640634 RepID=A0A7Y9JPJ7_9MICO|nr:3-oxoacyl-[acyl-carrier protein] reductase [Microbacterium pseudoresistens]
MKNKRVIVIGGAGAIGEAIVELLVVEGAAVVIADHNVDTAAQLAQRLSTGGTVYVAQIDITSEESVAAAFAESTRLLGGLDILVNCAGVIDEVPLSDMPFARWQRVIDLNLTGVFLACREAIPYLRQAGGGRIINIASQVGQRGRERLTHYAASKAGVIGLTKALARELAGERILVNSVAPGPISTPFEATLSEETLRETAKALPLGRSGVPAEVAPTVLLLAGDVSGALYVGQTLGPNSGDVML